MGCGGSSEQQGRYLKAAKKYDVCITCTSPVLSSDDFASFFGIWIMKICTELKLSATSGRPQLKTDPKPGSRESNSLRAALIASRVAVCIVNISAGEDLPPAGYRSELLWAQEARIPVVPFYDADRISWKDLCAWKVDMPAIFRSQIGPVRYHRKAHEQAKESLTVAIQEAMKEQNPKDDASDTSSVGRLSALSNLELSKAERRMLMYGDSQKQEEDEGGGVGANGQFLGLGRNDYERAGLVERKMERSNSMKDINLEMALSILAKQAKGDGPANDLLAPHDGGVRLQFAAGVFPNEQALHGSEPRHRVLVPTKGILKKKGKKGSEPRPLKQEAAQVKQLRLAPFSNNSISTEDRRLHFAAQELQKHLDSLQVDDVHELVTVVRCLKDGVDDNGLATRALRLLSAFLAQHPSLQARAVQQGCIPAITAAMRRHPDIDMTVAGSAALIAILEGGCAGEIVDDSAKDAEALNGVAGCVTLMTRSGGPEVLTNGMRHFPACELLQEKGCRCLGLLCKGGDDNRVSAGYKKGTKAESNMQLRSQARRLIARHGGVALLFDAMRRYPANVELQVGGCMALGQLGSSEVRIKRKAAAGGVMGLLFATMDKHPRDPRAQRWACAALRHLSSNSHENKTFIAQQGGIERLCEVCRHFSGAHNDVVTEAIGCMCHLASKHPENKQAIFEAGALELAMEALAGMPEAELAMSGCGLLHNLSCDQDIKRHVVKLGGRDTAERLSQHEASAVRNLALVLSRTLSPPAAAGGDPFGAIFATRTPGLVGARRATSKRGRKNAQAALRGVGIDVGSEPADGKKKGGKPRQDDDVRSESGSSEVSASSAASAASSYSGGGKRKPGQSKYKAGARRFAKTWDADGGGGAAGGNADFEDHASLFDFDDNASVCSSRSARSVGSVTSAMSHISLEANDCLGEADIKDAIEQFDFVKVRKEAEEKAAARAKRLKQQSAPTAGTEQATRAAQAAPLREDAVLLEEKRPSRQSSDAPAKSASFAERFRSTVSNIEEIATKKLDQAGRAAQQKATGRKR